MMRVGKHPGRVGRQFTTAAARKPTFPQLLRLKLPGALSAWETAGFVRNGDADDYALSIGGVDVGIGDSLVSSSWGWRDGPLTRQRLDKTPRCWDGFLKDALETSTEVEICGVRTAIDDIDAAEHEELLDFRASVSTAHPNGAVGIYSVCVTTPDFDGTLRAFEESGLELRRVRKIEDPASPLSRGLSMAFFKFGAPPGRDVILELVGPGASESAVAATVATERAGFPVSEHATIAGMVVEVPSIAPLASLLGPTLLSDERPAAQGGGRRIATFKHKLAGLPLPLAFITPSESSAAAGT